MDGVCTVTVAADTKGKNHGNLQRTQFAAMAQ
jgi:hypothetical protein